MARISEQEYIESAEALAAAGLTNELTELYDLYTAQQPVDYEFSESVKNYPKSALNAVGDFISAVSSPIDTATLMGNTAISGINNLGQMLEDALPESTLSQIHKFTNALGLPKRSVENPREPVPNQELGEAALEYYKNRYGSADAIKTTAMQDPAGMLLDIGGMLSGGGTLAAKAPSALGKVGQAAQKAGALLDPVATAIKLPVAAVEGVLGQPMSHKLYGSAMKPSTTLDINSREDIIQAGLDLNALPTIRSSKKIEELRRKTAKQLEEKLKESDQQGRLIDVEEILQDVGNVKDQFAPPRPSSVTAIPDIDSVMDLIREANELNGGRKLTIRELNNIKRDLDRSINWDRTKKIGGIAKSMSEPTELTYKQIANTARNIVAKHAPDIVPLNNLYGKIVDVQRNIQKQGTNRIQNYDLSNFGDASKIGTGQLLGDSTGAMFGGALAIADKPLPKAFLGLTSHKAGKLVRGPLMTPTTAATVTTERLADAEEDKKRKRLYSK